MCEVSFIFTSKLSPCDRSSFIDIIFTIIFSESLLASLSLEIDIYPRLDRERVGNE